MPTFPRDKIISCFHFLRDSLICYIVDPTTMYIRQPLQPDSSVVPTGRRFAVQPAVCVKLRLLFFSITSNLRLFI